MDRRDFIEDKNGLLSGGKNADKKGNYLASISIQGITLPMYTGQTGTDERTFAVRMSEHLNLWFENSHSKYQIGVSNEEFESGKCKLILEMLAESDSIITRKLLEEEAVSHFKPYLQSGPFKKYYTKYTGLDLCISPYGYQRRRAFIWRCKQEGIDISENNNPDLFNQVIELLIHVNLEEAIRNNLRTTNPYNEAAYIKICMDLRNRIKEYSSEYKTIKSIFDLKLYGNNIKRGCSYSFIINNLAKMLY